MIKIKFLLRLCDPAVLRIALMASLCWLNVSARADNPIVSHVYTADPAARVFNNRMYVITSHDLDNQNGYDMVDYHLFSSDDMANWTNHGIIFDVRTDVSWANLAYAPDFIERNGKYYMYFPDGGSSIGVAVADRPEGPWKDALGRALVNGSTPGVSGVSWIFDPGVFIDDDGSAYLYFGGGSSGNNLRVIRLNSDMISVSGSAQTIVAPNYFEAPYVVKRDGVYYLSYSTNGNGGSITIDYMTSNNPMSGYTHRGTALPNPWNNSGNNNHHSMVEWNNQWYMFYHNRAVSLERGASGYQRSINVDKLSFNGTTISVTPSEAGVPALKDLDPFARIEGETINQESGIETSGYRVNTYAEYDAQDWVKIANVNFGSGAAFFKARVATGNATRLQILLDSSSGSPAATIDIPATGGLQAWQEISVPVNNLSGKHDVYIKASGRLNLDWYTFVSQPQDCGTSAGFPVCCNIDSDRDRDGWGEEWGEACVVTPQTDGYAPLNGADVLAAINVGSETGDYYDGVYYQPDLYWTGGQTQEISNTITGAENSRVFQSERYGDITYEIPLENGRYSVELHFAELYWEASGSRSFSGSIEGQPLFSNLDLFQEVGQRAAYTQGASVDVSDGALSVNIESAVDNGTLSGILIRSLSASSSSSSSSSAVASSSSSSSGGTSSPSGGAFGLVQLLWAAGMLFCFFLVAPRRKNKNCNSGS